MGEAGAVPSDRYFPPRSSPQSVFYNLLVIAFRGVPMEITRNMTIDVELTSQDLQDLIEKETGDELTGVEILSSSENSVIVRGNIKEA